MKASEALTTERHDAPSLDEATVWSATPPVWPPPSSAPNYLAPDAGSDHPPTMLPFLRRLVSGWIPVAVLAAVAAVLAVVAFVLPGSSGPSLKGLQPQQILQASLAAANKSQSFHVVIHQSEGGQPVLVEGDISPVAGSVSSTFEGHSVSMMAVGQTDYFKADAAYLRALPGMPTTTAQLLGGRWFSLPASTTSDLNQMAELLKTGPIINDLLDLYGPIAEEAATTRAVTLTGAIPDNQLTDGNGAGDKATVVVSARSPFLPLSVSFSDPQNGTTELDFSLWAEKVSLSAPQSAVSMSQLASQDASDVRTAQSDLRNALTAELTYFTSNQAFDTTASPAGVQQLEPSLHFVANSNVTPGNEVLVTADHGAIVVTSAANDGNCYSIEEIIDPTGPVGQGTYYYQSPGTGNGNQTTCSAPSALVESLHTTPTNPSAASSPGTWSLEY